ncbi:M15 family metallopeptidase [Chryseotalea sanaruensis]|nr:M15 family metallopeptidase [Chryseotalea sanaruensis]
MILVRKILYGTTLMLLIVSTGWSQRYKYGLNPTMLADYQKSIAKNSANELIDLASFVPGIMLDIRYATANNFTKEIIYKQTKAYARKPVAEALKKAQESFAAYGVGIKVFDAYRPYSATVKFYEVYKDTTYVASPYKGSRHNRGCAIDMTLVDLKTGKNLKMPTEYDSFKKEAWPSTIVKDAEVKKNRDLIISVMAKHGFKVNSSEWWHFDFIGWQKFDVLDIDFEELE